MTDPRFTAAADAVARQARANISRASDSMAQGDIELNEWYRDMRREVKMLHMAEAALARGGWGNMRPQDWERVEKIIYEQFNGSEGDADGKGAFPGLRKFAEDVRDKRYGDDPEGLRRGFLSRSNSYSDAGRSTFQNEQILYREEGGHDQAKRILANVEHCPDCIAWAALGWIPIQEMYEKYPIGRSVCNNYCYCSIITRKKPLESEEEIEIRFGDGGDFGEIGMEVDWDTETEDGSEGSTPPATNAPTNVYVPARHLITEPSEVVRSGILDVADKLAGEITEEFGQMDLLRIAEAQGFTAKPTVIPHDEWMALADAEYSAGRDVLFRGLSKDKLGGIKAQVVGQADPVKAARNFIDGDYYASTYHLPGQPSGIYFTPNVAKAEGFAGQGGQLIKAVFHKEAKVVDLDVIRFHGQRIAEDLRKILEDEINSGASESRLKGLRMMINHAEKDPGYVAAIMGYDALQYPHPSYGKLVAIYNRSSLIVSPDMSLFT